jgi:hypothetical protein
MCLSILTLRQLHSTSPAQFFAEGWLSFSCLCSQKFAQRAHCRFDAFLL